MVKVISICNNKGGIGKTTSSLNLAKELVNQGKRVLLIDADSQGNASSFFYPEYKDEINSLDDFVKLDLNGKTPLAKLHEMDEKLKKEIAGIKDINNLFLEEDPLTIYECIKQTDYENLSVIPSLNNQLNKTNEEITRLKIRAEENGLDGGKYDRKLKNILRKVRKNYDYVIIDNCPYFNNITINAFMASDEIIIPIKPGAKFELDGFKETAKTAYEFKLRFGLNFKMRLLVTMFHRGKRPKYEAYVRKLKEWFPTNEDSDLTVLNSTIGYQDTPSTQNTMSASFLVDGKSNLGNDYKILTKEILELGD